MKAVNEQIVAKNQVRVMQFLDAVSLVTITTPYSKAASDVQTLQSKRQIVCLKEGYLVKRGQGRQKSFMGMSVAGLKNFKKRFFVLSSEGLIYYKDRGSDPLYRIHIENILGVERVDETTFGLEYMLQVIQPERVLYAAASNDSEQNAWIDILRQISKDNVNARKKYHPGAYINHVWTCCQVNDTTGSLGNPQKIIEGNAKQNITC